MSPDIHDNQIFSCVILGSYGRWFNEIVRAKNIFENFGIQVLYPIRTAIVGTQDGFALLDGQLGQDPRSVELEFLHLLKSVSRRGFAFFVNPDGLLGRSAAYELGMAQAHGVPCLFSAPLADLPAYTPPNSIWSADTLATYVATRGRLPVIRIADGQRRLYAAWRDLVAPNSVIATGGIIAHAGSRRTDILLVRTHKWYGRWSVVGGKVKHGERIKQALVREIMEETGLEARVGQHLCTFDQLRRSGYYDPATTHLFVDFVAHVRSRRVRLNDEAEEFVWMPARAALRDLQLEPNARKTVQLYAALPTA